MKKVRLSESELTRIVKKVINEQQSTDTRSKKSQFTMVANPRKYNNLGEKPKNESSLKDFLTTHAGVGPEQAELIAKKFTEVQSGKIDVKRAMFDVENKYMNEKNVKTTIPAWFVLYLLL